MAFIEKAKLLELHAQIGALLINRATEVQLKRVSPGSARCKVVIQRCSIFKQMEMSMMSILQAIKIRPLGTELSRNSTSTVTYSDSCWIRKLMGNHKM